MSLSIDNVEGFDFPKDDAEAGGRFQQYQNRDPLSVVPPALLNAGDIYDYARITGMIYPFATDERKLKEKLKPSSYELDFLGTVHYVDEKGGYQRIAINRNTPFILKKNSIVYVSLACKFRLPTYIAMRFNLRITHVHRGLLLGTGPLIDPGFVGRLLIPLHNLTDKDYVLIEGEGLIWVEFTKLSPYRDGARVVAFPEGKWNLTAREYFNRASDGTPAVSSIPGEVAQATEDAKKAQVHAEDAEKSSKRLLIGGVVALVVSLVAVIVGVLNLGVSTWNVVSAANKSISEYRGEVGALQERIGTLEAELQTFRRDHGTGSSIPR